MKYYKFLGNIINNKTFDSNTNLIKDRIYCGNEYDGNDEDSIEYWATDKYCDIFFQEVPEIEYLLQKAKEDYPKGTKCYDAYDGIERTVATKQWIEPKENDWIDGIYYSGLDNTVLVMIENEARGFYLYYKGKWAKKVEEKFVLPEKWCVKVFSNEEFHEVMNYLGDLKGGYFNKLHHKNFNPFPYRNNYYIGFQKDGSIFYNNIIKEHHGEEITFKQFEKYVLKKDMKDRKIIGYKLIKPELKSACRAIISDKDWFDRYWQKNSQDYSCNFGADDGNFSNHQVYQELKDAGVLDLWFEPLFEKEALNITINGYKGEFCKEHVNFGCQSFSVEFIKKLYDLMELKPKNGIDSLKEEIKQIVEYYKNKN